MFFVQLQLILVEFLDGIRFLFGVCWNFEKIILYGLLSMCVRIFKWFLCVILILILVVFVFIDWVIMLLRIGISVFNFLIEKCFWLMNVWCKNCLNFFIFVSFFKMVDSFFGEFFWNSFLDLIIFVIYVCFLKLCIWLNLKEMVFLYVLCKCWMVFKLFVILVGVFL